MGVAVAAEGAHRVVAHHRARPYFAKELGLACNDGAVGLLRGG
jgi:hypothetical protein